MSPDECDHAWESERQGGSTQPLDLPQQAPWDVRPQNLFVIPVPSLGRSGKGRHAPADAGGSCHPQEPPQPPAPEPARADRRPWQQGRAQQGSGVSTSVAGDTSTYTAGLRRTPPGPGPPNTGPHQARRNGGRSHASGDVRSVRAARGPPARPVSPSSRLHERCGASASADGPTRRLTRVRQPESTRTCEELGERPAAATSGDGHNDSDQPQGSQPLGGSAPAQGVQQARDQRPPSNLNRLQAALHGCDDDVSVEAALRAVAPGCKPSQATLTKLISKYSKTGSWRRGLAVFKHLHILGVTADQTLANAALWACKRGGDAAKAWLVYHEMRTMPEHPDIITYRALFPVLAADGLWQECVSAYLMARRDGVRLDGPAGLSMLLGLRQSGLWQIAEACLLTELSGHSKPHAFSSLAESAVAARDPGHPGHASPDAAQALLRKVQDLLREVEAKGGRGERGGAGGRGLSRDALVTPCCNVLLQMYAEAAPPQADRALAFIHAMASAHKAAPTGPLQPDVLSYGNVALAFCRAASVDLGLGVLTAYRHTGRRLTAAVFAPCMAAAAAAEDDAAVITIWRHMAALGVQTSDACSAFFIGAASRSGSPELAEEAVLHVPALSEPIVARSSVERDVSRLLVSLAQHSTPKRAVTAIQCVLAAGVHVPLACVTECVRVLSWRDVLCCAALRQTAAVAGFELPFAGTHM